MTIDLLIVGILSALAAWTAYELTIAPVDHSYDRRELELIRDIHDRHGIRDHYNHQPATTPMHASPAPDSIYRDPHIEQQPNGSWKVVGCGLPRKDLERVHATREEAVAALGFADEWIGKIH